MIRYCAKLIRSEIRAGRISGSTSGLAAGFVQANVAIVPARYADQFADFCAANSHACPLLYRSEPGQFQLAAVGEDVDIRRDVPRYRLYRKGGEIEEVTDISGYWRDDLVTFLLGCAFSFEEALITGGLDVRNVREGKNVPVYRTALACKPCGPFAANLSVTMRPFQRQQLGLVRRISRDYPLLHGEPLAVADPALLGIANLQDPDFGDAVSVEEGEVPAFWACGTTACEALHNAGLDFYITHSPGHMLVTDRLSGELEGIPVGGAPVWAEAQPPAAGFSFTLSTAVPQSRR